MGFGGGGSGSFVLPNHKHTNVLADGGALVGATSLIDLETIDAYFATEYALVKPTFTNTSAANTSFSTGSTSLVNVTSAAVTLQATGKFLFVASCSGQITGTTVGSLGWRLTHDGNLIDTLEKNRSTSTDPFTIDGYTLSSTGTSDGTALQVQTSVTSTTNVINRVSLSVVEVTE